MAFDAGCQYVVRKYQSLAKVPALGEQVTKQTNSVSVKGIDKSDYAYIIPYDDYYAPALLYQLKSHGLVVKVATKPFTSEIGGEQINFHRGALLVPVQDQYQTVPNWAQIWMVACLLKFF